jgi:hypothetical protein
VPKIPARATSFPIAMAEMGSRKLLVILRAVKAASEKILILGKRVKLWEFYFQKPKFPIPHVIPKAHCASITHRT